MDKKELIDLYKTTLEEFRHHDTAQIQAYIGLGIIIPFFLASIGLLLGRSSPVHTDYINIVKVGIFIFAIFVTAFFWWFSYRINKRFEACEKVREEIENLLEAEEGSKLDGVLVAREIANFQGNKRFTEIRLWIYIPVSIVMLIAFGLFLFMALR